MDKREAVRRYLQLFEGLTAIILKWDPYGLYKASGLDDEFSGEVARLLAALQSIESESAASDALQKVFSESFSEHDFPRSACEAVGSEVFVWWQGQR